MSDIRRKILQMHLIFMEHLKKADGVLTAEVYNDIEKDYKDLAVLADHLADEELVARLRRDGDD